MWYDMNGKPIDDHEANKLLQDRRRIIRSTWLTDRRERVHVSTVFLVLDHSFMETGPVLWETMVFGGAHDGAQNRYTSRRQARLGHEIMCQAVRATIAAQASARAQRRRMHASYRAKWAR